MTDSYLYVKLYKLVDNKLFYGFTNSYIYFFLYI